MTAARLEERWLEAKGGRIRYFVAGAGSPLALVHGLGGSATNWCELAPLLAPRHRLVIPDLPGHGGSDPLAAVSGLQPYADRVAAVLDRRLGWGTLMSVALAIYCSADASGAHLREQAVGQVPITGKTDHAC